MWGFGGVRKEKRRTVETGLVGGGEARDGSSGLGRIAPDPVHYACIPHSLLTSMIFFPGLIRRLWSSSAPRTRQCIERTRDDDDDSIGKDCRNSGGVE